MSDVQHDAFGIQLTIIRLVNPQDDAAKAALQAFCIKYPDSILLCRHIEQYMSFVESGVRGTDEFQDISKDHRLQELFASVFKVVSDLGDIVSTPADEGRCRGVSQDVVLRDLVPNVRPSFFSFANVLKALLTATQRSYIILHRGIAQDL